MKKSSNNKKSFKRELGQIFEFDTRSVYQNPLRRGPGLGAAVMLAFGAENHFYPEDFNCNQGYNNNLYIKGNTVYEYLGETPDPMIFMVREYGKIA